MVPTKPIAPPNMNLFRALEIWDFRYWEGLKSRKRFVWAVFMASGFKVGGG